MFKICVSLCFCAFVAIGYISEQYRILRTYSGNSSMDRRLKSKIIIDKIFTEGKTIFVFPVKMAYMWISTGQPDASYIYTVTVSKRNFKRAVDRNRIKRQMRESVRLNVDNISPKQNEILAMLFIYVIKEKQPYQLIDKAISKILMRIKK